MPRNPAKMFSVNCMTDCLMLFTFFKHFSMYSTFHVLDQVTYSPDRVLRERLNMWLGAKVKKFCSAAIVSLSNTGYWLFKNRETVEK
jgi:hypothetical protein